MARAGGAGRRESVNRNLPHGRPTQIKVRHEIDPDFTKNINNLKLTNIADVK